MKIEVKESEVKTLEKLKDGWSYKILTMNGNNIIGSGISTKEEALIHVQNQLITINKAMLRKQKK